MNDVLTLLGRRADTAKLLNATLNDPGTARHAQSWRTRLAEADAEIAACFAPDVDVEFRIAALTAGERDLAIRAAIGSSAYPNIRGRRFVETFMGAAVQTAPLLDLASKIDTTTGEVVGFSYITSQITAAGIVDLGGSIADSDPIFGPNRELNAYGYKSLLTISTEAMTDSAFDAERFCAERVGPINARDLSDDLWGGSGSGAPQGLLAGLSTVTAAGASVVTLDDVGALLEALPSEYAFGGRCTVLFSPGAYWDVRRQTLGTSAAGGMAVDASLPYFGGTVLGFPFRVDPALAAPGAAAKSVVAGDFATAYLIRLAPLRVDTAENATTDQAKFRVVLRADGRRMVTDAARALVHP